MKPPRAVVVFGLMAACRPPTEDVQRPAPLAVRAVEIRHETRPPMVREGQVSASARYHLGFRAAGVLRAVRVHEGDLVQRGQLLAELENVDVAAAVQAADADLGEATSDSEVTARLMSTGSIAKREFDRAASALARALARQRQASQALDDTRLFSPVSGKVYARTAEPGETAGPGRTVMIVDEVGAPCVRVGLPERDLARVVRDQPVTVRAAEDAVERSYTGKVTRLVAAPNVDDALYTVEIGQTGDAWDGLRLGSRVSLTFQEAAAQTVVQLPLDAIVRRRARDVVFVLDGAAAAVHEREVVLGRAEGEVVALDRGLTDGERVVTEGAYFLQDGDPVVVAR
jgi:RND family efflux transporter MFP subunit